MADADPRDRDLLREAWAQSRVANDLRFVRSGEELMDYLCRRGRYADAARSPRPELILMDLLGDGGGGFDALAEIKTNPGLRRIPVVILTRSSDEADLVRSYELGANSVATKPETFAALGMMIRELGQYWFEVVSRPKAGR